MTFSIRNDAIGVVIGRNSLSNSKWKNYKGGMVGEIWVNNRRNKIFKRILETLPGNPVNPIWIDDRIWFLSDHKKIGNLYSCNSNGTNINQETFHSEYYVRQFSTDGKNIVYHCGGNLWNHTPNKKNNPDKPIPIKLNSSRDRTKRKFFFGDDYLEDACIHPEGHEIAILSRGKIFSMPHWEHSVKQYGKRHGVRYRLPCWLHLSLIHI